MGVVVAIPLLLSTCYASGIKCRVTSYNPTKEQCGNSKGITASGLKAQKGMVAADWRVYPPGTILYCNDTEEIWVVADKGGGVKGTHIDRFVPTMKENKYYSGGKLVVSVLYKPESYSRKTAHVNTKKAFAVREQIKPRGKELTSRGGFDRIKSEIHQMMGQPIKTKEQNNNGRTGTVEQKREIGNSKDINHDFDGFRNLIVEELYFKSRTEGQKWSVAPVKGSKCYPGFNFNIITSYSHDWNNMFQSK